MFKSLLCSGLVVVFYLGSINMIKKYNISFFYQKLCATFAALFLLTKFYLLFAKFY